MSTSANQAISSTQSAVTTCMVLYVVFAIAYPSLITAIREQKAITQLYTWLQLRDFSKALPKVGDKARLGTRYFAICDGSDEFRQVGKGYAPECPYVDVGYPDETRLGGIRYDPLTIESYWPEAARYRIHLYRQRGSSIFYGDKKDEEYLLKDGRRATFYDVVSPEDKLPFSDYEIVRTQNDRLEEVFLIIQKSEYGHLRSGGGDNDVFLEYYQGGAIPRYWDVSQLLLIRAGLDSELSTMNPKAPEFAKFVTAAGSASANIKVLGIDIPAFLASLFFQVIIALVAVWTLGPLRILRASPPSDDLDRSWLFLWPKGAGGWWVELPIYVASILFSLAPIGFFFIQVSGGIFREFGPPTSTGLIGLSLVCVATSVAIFISLANQLRRLRATATP